MRWQHFFAPVYSQSSGLEHYRVTELAQGSTRQQRIQTRVLLIEGANSSHCATARYRVITDRHSEIVHKLKCYHVVHKVTPVSVTMCVSKDLY